jgi:hypothetical protein
VSREDTIKAILELQSGQQLTSSSAEEPQASEVNLVNRLLMEAKYGADFGSAAALLGGDLTKASQSISAGSDFLDHINALRLGFGREKTFNRRAEAAGIPTSSPAVQAAKSTSQLIKGGVEIGGDIAGTGLLMSNPSTARLGAAIPGIASASSNMLVNTLGDIVSGDDVLGNIPQNLGSAGFAGAAASIFPVIGRLTGKGTAQQIAATQLSDSATAGLAKIQKEVAESSGGSAEVLMKSIGELREYHLKAAYNQLDNSISKLTGDASKESVEELLKRVDSLEGIFDKSLQPVAAFQDAKSLLKTVYDSGKPVPKKLYAMTLNLLDDARLSIKGTELKQAYNKVIPKNYIMNELPETVRNAIADRDEVYKVFVDGFDKHMSPILEEFDLMSKGFGSSDKTLQDLVYTQLKDNPEFSRWLSPFMKSSKNKLGLKFVNEKGIKFITDDDLVNIVNTGIKSSAKSSNVGQAVATVADDTLARQGFDLGGVFDPNKQMQDIINSGAFTKAPATTNIKGSSAVKPSFIKAEATKVLDNLKSLAPKVHDKFNAMVGDIDAFTKQIVDAADAGAKGRLAVRASKAPGTALTQAVPEVMDVGAHKSTQDLLKFLTAQRAGSAMLGTAAGNVPIVEDLGPELIQSLLFSKTAPNYFGVQPRR